MPCRQLGVSLVATVIVFLAAAVVGALLAPTSWTLRMAFVDSDRLLPRPSYITLRLVGTIPDASSAAELTYTVEPGAVFTAVVQGDLQPAPGTPVSSASIGLPPVYATGTTALPWSLRADFRLVINLTTSANAAYHVIPRPPPSASSPGALFNTRNAYETWVDKAGTWLDMAADPLCSGGSSPAVFKCCATSTGTYAVHYLAFNSTAVACTRSNPAASIGDGNFTLAAQLQAKVALRHRISTSPVLDFELAAALLSPVMLLLTSDNASSLKPMVSSLSSTEAAAASASSAVWDGLRAGKHIVNATLTASPSVISFLSRPRGLLNADPTLRWCRTGGADAAPSALDPGATAPFFAASWLFGDTKNTVGYSATTYAAEKQCAAPRGFYTSIGPVFNAFDQFASVRYSARTEALFPGCSWPATAPPPLTAGSSSGVSVDTTTANATTGVTGTLDRLQLACSNAGPTDVVIEASVALSSTGLDAALTRRFPVLRVTDSFSRASVTRPSAVMDSSCVVTLDVVVDVMNVEEYGPVTGLASVAASHLTTTCHPTDPGDCQAFLTAASSPATTVTGSIDPFATCRVATRREAQLLPRPQNATGHARGSSFIQVVETTGLQSVTVELPWLVNWTSAQAVCDSMRQQAAITASPAAAVRLLDALRWPQVLPIVRSAGADANRAAVEQCFTVDFERVPGTNLSLSPTAIAPPWWETTTTTPTTTGNSTGLTCALLSNVQCTARYGPQRPYMDPQALRCTPFAVIAAGAGCADPLARHATRSVSISMSPSHSRTRSLRPTPPPPWPDPIFGAGPPPLWWAPVTTMRPAARDDDGFGPPSPTAPPITTQGRTGGTSSAKASAAAGATFFTVDILLAAACIVAAVVPVGGLGPIDRLLGRESCLSVPRRRRAASEVHATYSPRHHWHRGHPASRNPFRMQARLTTTATMKR
jgi:hypothetical protein